MAAVGGVGHGRRMGEVSVGAEPDWMWDKEAFGELQSGVDRIWSLFGPEEAHREGGQAKWRNRV